jgi:H(+)-translocating pyrophosphatase
MLGILTALAFLFGAVCSAASGYISMWVAAQSNIRVASSARRSYAEALVVCFRGGAFSALLNLTLCVSGVTTLYVIFYQMFVLTGSLNPEDLPMLMVGYGFGASFVALFMQLGGGIYTKAADVGADLVGKVESNIPEDDPRNPAVIADLVGDMVGDCVGSSADVFESVAAEIIGAMILGSTVVNEAGLEGNQVAKILLFPLLVHAMDIIVSSIGISIVNGNRGGSDSNPMVQLQQGYRVAMAMAVAGFYFITWWLLDIEDPDTGNTSSFKFFLCGIVGMLCAYIIVLSTQYYTDYEYKPVQSIAEASTTGHGTNIIVGVSVGMKATLIPTIAVAISVLLAYHLGASTNIGEGHNAGLFGTAVATMGMLSNAVYILSMNNFGPIADNAGGIAEMSMQPAAVRDATDRLDAAGNVTKAITKGYSIGSASMACFLLFGAFMDEFSEFAGIPFNTVNIATPEVLVGGLIGSMIIFYFTGLAISAVGRTAHEVVLEVRRQFRENPDIMTYKAKPDYERCVSLVTAAALKEMQFPGLVCVCTPIVIGVIFRLVGEIQGKPLLGAEVLAAYLMFGTVTGILMALFLDTAGGAWDNAKKYIEIGNFGGKNSEAHKASITGDTVGDPFKDTAGPSLHVVIKLLSTTILVAGPLFIARS